MLRISYIALAALALPAHAFAIDTVTCVDNAGEVRLVYAIGPALVQPILSVEMQLTDDFGISTDPDHPDHDGEYVSRGFVGDDVEGGEVSWRDDRGSEHRALSFRIGRVTEARKAQVGGVLAVNGGGLWTVTCRSSDLGM